MEFLINFRSDAELVREAIGDRAAAFEVLVHRYQRKAHAIARAAGVSAGAVDDVVQEAFLRGFQRLPDLREPSSFGPWFLTIVRNTARSHLRAAGRAGRAVGPEAIDAREWRDPETLEGKELQDQLWRRVAELPEGLREAIFLYYHDGESVRAVARALGTSTAVASDRLRRGRDLLRARLWRELRSELRDMLPSARAWKKKGRRLALVALASLAPSLTRAAGASAISTASTLSTGPSIIKPILGGFLMSGKKLAAVCSLACILFLGGIVYFVDPLGFRGERPAAETGLGTGTEIASGPDTRGSRTDPAKTEQARAGAETREIASIAGRAISAGRGVERARVLALNIATWQTKTDAEFRTADSARTGLSPERLRQAGLRAARILPETASDPAGGFQFRGLPDGTYRILAGREGFLPSSSTLVEVRQGTPARCLVELIPSLAIEGKVVDGSGSPVGGAAIEAQATGWTESASTDRIERLKSDWVEGIAVLALAPAVSGAGGEFRIDSLEPTSFNLRAGKEGFLDAEAFQIDAGSRGVRLTLDAGSSVTGRVLDPARGPVKGAEVALSPARGTEIHRLFDWMKGNAGSSSGPRAITDDGGRFRISGLAPSGHVLVATARGYPALELEVAVPESALEIGDLVLQAPRSISGEVRDPAGTQIPGARVWVPRARRLARPSNESHREDREALVETVSGVDGKFVLEGLAAAAVEVRASVEGFAGASAASVASGTRGLILVLDAGLTIHGKVIDGESSEPVGGAEVVLGFDQELKTTSDARGAFLVRGFPSSALHFGCATVRASHPRRGSYQDYNCLMLGRDERSPLIISLSRLERITGRVEDSEGQPVGGAQLSIEVTGLPEEAMGYNPARGIHALSDAEGLYTLDAPTGLRSMIGDLRYAVVAAHSARGKGRSENLRLTRAGEPWPTVDLMLGGSVIEGKVLGEDGKPISKARVWARRSAGPEDAEWPGDSLPDERATCSGLDGAYRLTGVEPGPTQLAAAALGHAPRLIAGLTAGPAPLSQDIVLSTGGTVEGRVLDGAGSPISDAEVVAFPERKDQRPSTTSSEYTRRMRLLKTSGIASARSGAGGAFRISQLPEGSFFIVARAPGYEAALTPSVSSGAGGLELVLHRFGAILGSVRASDDRSPITRLKVDVLDRKKLPSGKGPRGAFSDYRVASEGEVVFEHPAGRFVYDGLRPGEYTVLVQSPGFRFSVQDVTVAGGDEVPMEFLLDRGARLDGVVLDAETGLPVAGAQVTLGGPSQRGYLSGEPGQLGEVRPFAEGVETRADGSFSAGGLVDGQQQVMVSHPLYLFPQPTQMEVSAGEARTVEIKLAPAGRVEGRIAGTSAGLGARSLQSSLAWRKVEEDGPAAGTKPNPASGRPVWMDPEGRFHADNLEPGTYHLELKQQVMERGESVHIGPSGGFSTNRPVGPEKTIPLGQVEVRPRETALFNGRAPEESDEAAGEKD